jgi:hypothetical protein
VKVAKSRDSDDDLAAVSAKKRQTDEPRESSSIDTGSEPVWPEVDRGDWERVKRFDWQSK